MAKELEIEAATQVTGRDYSVTEVALLWLPEPTRLSVRRYSPYKLWAQE